MKQSAKRLLSMLFSLLFLVAAFVFFFDLIQPAYNSVETLRGQLIAENQSLANEKIQVAQAESLISSYNEESQAQTSVGLAIPSGENVAGALAQVEGIAQNDDVAITSIGISAPALSKGVGLSAGQAGSSTAQAVNPLGNFSLNVAGSASYENLKSFLQNLETNIRIFDLESLSLTETPAVAPLSAGKNVISLLPASRDSLNYAMSIQTYYQVP